MSRPHEAVRHNTALVPNTQAPTAGGSKHQPRCLVSVRDVGEAQIALSAGVHWIDLKNPQAGSLGAPTAATAQKVGKVLSGFPNRSVALGELRELFDHADWTSPMAHGEIASALAIVQPIAEGFPIAKVGLSGLVATSAASVSPATASPLNNSNDRVGQEVWGDCFSALAAGLRSTTGTRLVPVLYADAELVAAPKVAAVFEAARRNSAPYLLIDTYTKDGRGLLNWLSPADLGDICTQAAGSGCRVIAAGSLDAAAVAALQHVDVEAFAVRGAVCLEHRTDAICPRKLAEWMKRFE